MRTEAGRILIAERIIGNDKIDDYGEVLRYNVFHVELVIRHAVDRKLYLYDIINIKKETSTPLEP